MVAVAHEHANSLSFEWRVICAERKVSRGHGKVSGFFSADVTLTALNDFLFILMEPTVKFIHVNNAVKDTPIPPLFISIDH